MPKGPNINGIELTNTGMIALFNRLGHPNLKLGRIASGNATINTTDLDNQGFMPLLTGVGPTDSGHWVMLIKGKGNQYFLFDPMGRASGANFQSALAKKLPAKAQISVLPVKDNINMGLCSYWVASAGLQARELLKDKAKPDLVAVGKTITNNIEAELANDGYNDITQWIGTLAQKIDGDPVTNPQKDASTLRQAAKAVKPVPVPDTPTEEPKPKIPEWSDFSLYTDAAVKQAAKYAFDHHLSTPYKPGNMEATPAVLHGKTVYRQTHGLAHTLRTMAYSEVIVEEARKAVLRGETLEKFPDGRTLSDVTPQQLKKIMIAQAFFVVGREGEESDPVSYKKYHENSRKAFLDYVEASKATLIPHTYKDQAEVDYFADIVEDKKSSDGKSMWNASPEHMLMNQSHMVDLLRVKQPAESYLESYFRTLKNRLGTKGAEAVFNIQRKFFHATYENVTAFDPANKEPHLVISGLGRYVMEHDVPVREASKGGAQGALKFFPQAHKLTANQRFMRVDEYLKLPEIASVFPGANKTLEGGYPGLNYKQNLDRTSSKERAMCETDVDYCLNQLGTAHAQARLEPIKTAFQSSPSTARRSATADELAAAQIIRQILANPEAIKVDHVELNGQRMETGFFRELLANCDMALVGALLNDTDLSNIDKLMSHEKNTLFHTTSEPVTEKPVGAMWAKEYRKNNRIPIREALIHMMQDGAWYYTRLNAIAQGRDSNSSFKEVLISTLMIPATQKAIVETQPKHEQKPPHKIYRGMHLPDELRNKVINQSEAIIANMGVGLFTDASAKTYQKMKLNNFSKMLARTCLSTSVDRQASEVFGNFMVDINDPDGLLDPKRIGIHTENSEAEYSIYLPDDVGLVPTRVSRGKAGSPDVVTLIAVKSPDFAPRHKDGFALNPYMAIQSDKVSALKNAVTAELPTDIDQKLTDLRKKAREQGSLPIREFWDRLSHRISLTDDGKISAERKTFLNTVVTPVLQQCHIALRTNNKEMMEDALKKFPTNKQWSQFVSHEAVKMKSEVDALKRDIEKKLILENTVLISLEGCKTALDEQDIPAALIAIEGLPTAATLTKMHSSPELVKQVDSLKHDLQDTLAAIKDAPVSSPSITDPVKLKARYELLIAATTERVVTLEKLDLTKYANSPSFLNAVNYLRETQEETQLLRTEKDRIKQTDDTVDTADIDALEVRLRVVDTKLYDNLLAGVSKGVTDLEQIKPSDDHRVFARTMDALNKMQKDLQVLREETMKRHVDPDKAVDMTDIEALEHRVQIVNQKMVQSIVSSLRPGIEAIVAPDMFANTEDVVKKYFEALSSLEKTLDQSPAAERQKQGIQELRDMYSDKQKAYPHLVQLQLKKEELILHLQEIYRAHQEQRETQKPKPETGLYGYAARALTTVDATLRPDIYERDQAIAKFQNDLIKPETHVNQALILLEQQRPSYLQEGLGITENDAQNLLDLIEKLNEPGDAEAMKQKVDSVNQYLKSLVGVQAQHDVIDDEIEQDRPFGFGH